MALSGLHSDDYHQELRTLRWQRRAKWIIPLAAVGMIVAGYGLLKHLEHHAPPVSPDCTVLNSSEREAAGTSVVCDDDYKKKYAPPFSIPNS